MGDLDITNTGWRAMEMKLTRDELAVMKCIYIRARGFGKENGYWANALKKEVGMTDDRYKRAVSFLRELSLAVTEKGKMDDPEPKDGEWIHLTGAGVNAYRNAVPKEEWDAPYDAEQCKDQVVD